MLRAASKKYKINLSKSFMIGDRWKDIEAGKKVNCQTIFINRGYSENFKQRIITLKIYLKLMKLLNFKFKFSIIIKLFYSFN